MSNDNDSIASPWTLLKTLRWTTDYFQRCHIDQARVTAEILLAHALGCDRIDLYLRHDQPLHADELARFKSMIQRRARREPDAYIVGRKEFWSLSFKVTPAVLIPRPETECLVETVLELCPVDKPLEVLELGVGSGAVSVALAHERPCWSITATDVSAVAIEVARENADQLVGPGRIRFLQGSWFEPLADQPGAFDLIVSNPPYVAREDLAGLEPEIIRFEPRGALDGGPGGLESISTLIRTASRYLKANGMLILEIGHDQAGGVKALADQTGSFGSVTVRKDYSGLDRVAVLK